MRNVLGEEEWVEAVLSPLRHRIRQLEDDNSDLRSRVRELQSVFYPDDKTYLRPTSTLSSMKFQPVTTCVAVASAASHRRRNPTGVTLTSTTHPSTPHPPTTLLSILPPSPPFPNPILTPPKSTHLSNEGGRPRAGTARQRAGTMRSFRLHWPKYGRVRTGWER